MKQDRYDLVVIGAGSGGLVGARFAAQLGAKVALIEKNRIGGDCTWTGCVPSKALLKAAKIAHHVRTAAAYGVIASPPTVDMARVREYVRGAIDAVYQLETPEELAKQGVEVASGMAHFVNASSIEVNGRRLSAKAFLVTTGATAVMPPIVGLEQVPFMTYESIFENEVCPQTMVIVGGGPIGMEMAQAYQRLGAQVTVVAGHVLPKEDADVQQLVQTLLEREGVRFLREPAISVSGDSAGITLKTAHDEAHGELLLIATGRAPNVKGLKLENAGVQHTPRGIPVDKKLRTNVKHIYAAGDVLGGYQFTHYAGWQAFQAVRNALLPGSSSGTTELVPRVTFTDPEVAHVGMTEQQALSHGGAGIKIYRHPMKHVDRAICENDGSGFIKFIIRNDGTILGATIVAARAGEAIMELVIAMNEGIKLKELAGAIHPYPTYSTGIQQMAADIAVEQLLSGTSGKLVRALSKIARSF
jgi:pyruvate/2-oxoglutarate dehydrogenase complex dihydrolipoamide dehydrogenase (E3) component